MAHKGCYPYRINREKHNFPVISPSAFAAMENRSSKDKPVPSAVTAVMELCSLQVLRSWQ